MYFLNLSSLSSYSPHSKKTLVVDKVLSLSEFRPLIGKFTLILNEATRMIDRFGLFLLEFGRLFKKDVSGERELLY